MFNNGNSSTIFIAGPRFALQLIKVFEGSFGGDTLYENPHYVTPNAVSVTPNML